MSHSDMSCSTSCLPSMGISTSEEANWEGSGVFVESPKPGGPGGSGGGSSCGGGGWFEAENWFR